MIGVKIRVEGVEKAQRELWKKYRSKLEEYKAWLKARMEQYLEEIRAEIPTKSGKTRDSVYLREISGGKNHGTFQLMTDSEVIFYLEYGTKAHGPVRAKALHWTEGGQEIYAKWVRGIEAHGMIARATARLNADLQAAWEA